MDYKKIIHKLFLITFTTIFITITPNGLAFAAIPETKESIEKRIKEISEKQQKLEREFNQKIDLYIKKLPRYKEIERRLEQLGDDLDEAIQFQEYKKTILAALKEQQSKKEKFYKKAKKMRLKKLPEEDKKILAEINTLKILKISLKAKLKMAKSYEMVVDELRKKIKRSKTDLTTFRRLVAYTKNQIESQQRMKHWRLVKALQESIKRARARVARQEAILKSQEEQLENLLQKKIVKESTSAKGP
jgi:DNA repair exonuclease SbcCD ATPase subunit